MYKETEFFNHEELHNFTRKRAFECYIPRTKIITGYHLVKLQEPFKITDPCKARFIPPQATLNQWQVELNRTSVAVETYAIEFEFLASSETYDIEAVFLAQKLHKARDVKQAVRKELEWFSSTTLIPNSIHISLPVVSMNAFKSFIHDSSYLDKLPLFDMVPEELARVWGRRYLSDEHMLWAVAKLNESQSDVLCVYINFVRNIRRFCQKQMSEHRMLPKKILFLMNVGFSSTGKTFLGSDARSGCHFSLAVFGSANNVMTYGDSLGWPVPENLKDTVNEYVGALFEKEQREITINECHSSTSTFNGLHRCQELCNAFYPLQNDGDLCGVISIIMASIVCLSPNFAEHVFVTPYGSKKDFPYLYLSEPSKYGKYLRSVLAIWMVESHIDIQRVVPTSWKHSLAEVQISSDSDDDINIPRMVNSFQHDSYNNSENAKIPTETAALKEKQSNVKTNSNSITSYSCPTCKQAFNVKSNRTRHIKNKHKDATNKINLLSKGDCLCLECGLRFYKITHLRDHLHASHGFSFAVEEKNHSSEAGIFSI